MNTLTIEEIDRIYSQISGWSPEQIKTYASIIDISTNYEDSPSSPSLWAMIKQIFKPKKKKEEAVSVEKICRVAIVNNSSTIRSIMKKYPHSTEYILEILHLLAPAIAQQYTGLSGLAIIGTLTILCKQGISEYLKKE